jgi:hypothetical protein
MQRSKLFMRSFENLEKNIDLRSLSSRVLKELALKWDLRRKLLSTDIKQIQREFKALRKWGTEHSSRDLCKILAEAWKVSPMTIYFWCFPKYRAKARERSRKYMFWRFQENPARERRRNRKIALNRYRRHEKLYEKYLA